jgi:hypothetical protein
MVLGIFNSLKLMNFFEKIKRNRLPIYPFLIGLFPVLYLWNANRTQEPAYVVIPSLLVTFVVLLLIYLVSLAFLRSSHSAALFTAVLAFFLLTFGQFYTLASAWNNGFIRPYLIPASIILILDLLIVVAYRRLGSPTLTQALNLVSAALILFQLVQAVPYYLSIAQIKKVSAGYNPEEKLVPVTGGGPQRDVYFILLDNYGRQDILQQGSNFDNHELVDALKQRGFIFPDCAQGNYMDTAPVIASILNMDYLDKFNIPEKSYIQRGGYGDLAPLILDSQVIQKFHSYGYHVVTFRGFMGLIDITNSDTYVTFEKDTGYSHRLETNNFQTLYYKTTLFSTLNEQYKIYPDLVLKKGPPFLKKLMPAKTAAESLAPQFNQVYQQNIYAFDALTRIPREIPGPKFVYAHMYAAHWPFMMKPDGSLRLPFTEELTVPGYVDGVRYTNSRILGAIDSILANSKTKPVIILQGDHSNEWVKPVEWSGKDRLKILSAYYLPDGGDQLLYKTISPVNNFRLVFQKYFGEQISLLPDIYHYIDPQTKAVGIAPSTCMTQSSEYNKSSSASLDAR